MNTDTNTDSTASTRLLDDLLWLYARGCSNDGLRKAVEAMIADYTDDADRYSDGLEVWEWYEEFPGYNFGTKGELHLPPHRRTAEHIHTLRARRDPLCTSFGSTAAGNEMKEIPALTTTFDKHINVVDALTEYIIQQGAIKFRKLVEYLETLGVNTAGDESLTGEHVNQPHVQEGTTLLCPVSTEFVEVVEALFNTRPVMLMIGDPASFANHEEPWWVAWAGDPAALT